MLEFTKLAAGMKKKEKELSGEAVRDDVGGDHAGERDQDSIGMLGRVNVTETASACWGADEGG